MIVPILRGIGTGFHEMAEVRLVCAGGAIIAQVQGAKICLSHSMAQSILVATA